MGRTGSGKSTFLLSLTRILDKESGLVKGDILIDNINIYDLKLTRLRKVYGVIPQDSYVIEGTLKENIDPLS